MTNKKKVAIVFTGGTISMTVDEKVGDRNTYFIWGTNNVYGD